MRVIIAIVGNSGTGKTVAAEFASRALDIPVIRSYTTRPMRDGEAQGREHIFVPEGCSIPRKEDMLAYTFFGGHHYWALKSQVKDERVLYVIDEDGVRGLKKRFGEEYVIIPILIRRDRYDVGRERMARDFSRKPLEAFYAVIDNDSTLEHLFYSLCRKIEEGSFDEWYKDNKDKVW